MRLFTLLSWTIGLTALTAPSVSRVIAPASSDATLDHAQAIRHNAMRRQRFRSWHAHQEKRAAGTLQDSVWDEDICRGAKLVQAMQASDSDAAKLVGKEGSAESSWKDYGDLESWGYTEDKNAEAYLISWGLHLETAFAALKLDHDWKNENDDKNSMSGVNHNKETEHDNVKYSPTAAEFWTAMNVEEGVLIAWHKYTAAYKGPHQDPPVTSNFPKLKSWSDIAFLQWKNQAAKEKKSPDSPRYIISTEANNDETKYCLGRALKIENRDPFEEQLKWGVFSPYEDCKDYPWDKKVTWMTDSDEGKAILGSPNGRGAGLLLATHKSTFGAKFIDSVVFWCEDDYINLLFNVANVATPEKEDPPPHGFEGNNPP